MKGFCADFRHAGRIYAKTRRGTSIAVLALALGMAFSGAFLSLYVDLVLRPDSGFQDSRKVSTIGQHRGGVVVGMPFEVLERLSGELASIEAAAMVEATTVFVDAESEPVAAGLVSSEFFSGLRPRTVLGHGFSAEDHYRESEPVAVLSYRYWHEQFDGDPNVIGKVLEVSRNPDNGYHSMEYPPEEAPEQESASFRIVGVMPQTLPHMARLEPDIWLPLERSWPLFVGTAESLRRLPSGPIYVRRAAGASTTAVREEFRALYDSPDAVSDREPGTQLDAIDGFVRNLSVQRETRRQLEFFLAASLLLAIVAAGNVSLFLLARAPGRRRELGIRMAVGAPLTRLARQLATESGLLVAIGGFLGLLGSIWLSETLPALDMMRDAEWDRVTLFDWRVLGLFSLSLLLLGILVSLAPIMGLRRLSIAQSSRQVSARASLAQRVTGTAQLAFAAAIGAAAVAFGWHLSLMMFGAPGYDMSDRYLVDGDYADVLMPKHYRRDSFLSIPGVTAVAFGTPVPAARSFTAATRISHPTEPGKTAEVVVGLMNRHFVELLGLGLLYGRAPEEDETAPVAVVNQTLARTFWGRDDVVGEWLPPSGVWGSRDMEIIGVLEDVSFGHPSASVPPYVFSLAARGIAAQALTVIETKLTASALQQELDRLASAGALEMTVRGVIPLSALRVARLASDRVRAMLTVGAAAIVVFLAAIGFYGTQHYLVASGQREYAIRAALGAGPTALGRSVLTSGILTSVPGLAVGGLLAFITVAWVRDKFSIQSIPPVAVTLLVVIGLVAFVLAASLGPAKRAKTIQPALLLRQD